MRGAFLKSTRQRYQSGSIRKVQRSVGFVWEYRYRDHSQPNSPMRQVTLSGEKYPTESKALSAVQHLVMKLNGTEAYTQKKQATMAALIQRYIETERLHTVKATRPVRCWYRGRGAVFNRVQLFDNLESLSPASLG